jgi:hypothetical protein
MARWYLEADAVNDFGRTTRIRVAMRCDAGPIF